MKGIHILDKKSVEKKVQDIKSQGLDRLHIVTDFDRTLTKCFFDEKRIFSVFALIRQGGYLKDDYSRKAFELFDNYHPIEIDESLDYDYRSAKMQEWWETHKKLLIESGMHEKVIADIIENYPKVFREGVTKFLDYLNHHKIPILIFSSGIGNFIEGYLAKEDRFTSNVYILSNTFEFDKEGFATGYKDEIIHVMNKSEIKIKDKKYKKVILKRNNVILLGDSISDIGMVSDIDCNIILKIGFLNEDVESKLELYKSKFDIVITGDGSLDYVNNLFNELNKE